MAVDRAAKRQSDDERASTDVQARDRALLLRESCNPETAMLIRSARAGSDPLMALSPEMF
jgi:hypothetical protein